MDIGRKRTAAQWATGLAVLLLCLGWMLLSGGQVKAVDVTDEKGLDDAIGIKEDYIHIIGSFSISGTKTINFPTVISGDGETRKLKRNGFDDAMFVFEGDVGVTFRNVTLDGYLADETAEAPLIQVNKGARLAATGLTLQNNVNVQEYNTVAKGGAIYNNGGSVTLNACTISGNSAGKEDVGGKGPFPGSGGGIFNTGTLTVEDSTIIGNTAVGTAEKGSGYGGGIYSNKPTGVTKAGDLVIKDSKIGVYTDTVAKEDKPAGNTATLGGGGIYVGNNNHDSGNQMAPTVPTGDENTSGFTLADSKVSHNTVTKAGYADTFFGYGDCGGGIAVIGNVTADITRSKIDNNTCTAFIPTTGNEGRLVQTYGGGGLHIYAYKQTSGENNSRWPIASTAINFSGSTAHPTTIDNNNAANRPGGGVTIQYGAVNMTGDVSISNNRAVASLGGYQGGGGIFMTDGSLIFKADAGSAAPTIMGNTVDNYTNNNIKSSAGGGICLDGGGNPEFTMEAGEISGNTAMVKGGGIYSTKKVTINGGTIANNIVCTDNENTTAYGGGICNESTGGGGTLNLTGGSIVGNEAGKIDSGTCYPGYGGGVYNANTMNMTGGTIGEQTNENKATQKGGGVYSSGKFSHSGGAIAHNIAGENSVNGGSPGYGGGVYVAENEYNFSGTAKIYGNSALAYGGKGGDGGGVYLMTESGQDTVPVKMTMTGGSIGSQADGEAANQAFGHGGGVYVGKDTTLDIAGGIIGTTTDEVNANNASKDGGGVYVDSGGTLEMSAGDIRQNLASGLGGGTYLSSGGNFTMSGGSMVNNNTEQGTDKKDNDLWLAAGENKISAAISGKVNIGTADSFNWNKFNLAVPKDKSLANDAKIGIGNNTSSGNLNITANDTAIIENLANTNTDNQFAKQFGDPAGTLKVLGNLDSNGKIVDGYTLVLVDPALPHHLSTDTVLDWSSESATEFKLLASDGKETKYPLSSSVKAVFTQGNDSKELTDEDGYNYDAENGKISVEGDARKALQNNPLTSGADRNMTFFMGVLYDKDKPAKYFTTYNTTFNARGEVYAFAQESYEWKAYADSYQMVVKDFPGDVYKPGDPQSPYAFSLDSGSTNINASFAMGTDADAGNLLITIPRDTLAKLADGDYEPVLTVKGKDEGNKDLIYATAKTKLKVAWVFDYHQGFSEVTDPNTPYEATIKTYKENEARKANVVKVDGNIVPIKNQDNNDNYVFSQSVNPDGVELTFTAAFHRTLSNGPHSVEVEFKDSESVTYGTVAQTTLTKNCTNNLENKALTKYEDSPVIMASKTNVPEWLKGKSAYTYSLSIGGKDYKENDDFTIDWPSSGDDAGAILINLKNHVVTEFINGTTADVKFSASFKDGGQTRSANFTGKLTVNWEFASDPPTNEVKDATKDYTFKILTYKDTANRAGTTVTVGGQELSSPKDYNLTCQADGEAHFTFTSAYLKTLPNNPTEREAYKVEVKYGKDGKYGLTETNLWMNINYSFDEDAYYLESYTPTLPMTISEVPDWLHGAKDFVLTMDGSKIAGDINQETSGKITVTLPTTILATLANKDESYPIALTVTKEGKAATFRTPVFAGWKFKVDPSFPVVTDNTKAATGTIVTYLANADRDPTIIKVGDAELTKGVDYTTEGSVEGAVKLNLTPAFLQTLDNGNHAVQVDYGSYGAAETSLKVLVAQEPSIVTQPQGASYLVGDTAKALNVLAKSVDGGTLSYQWYRDGKAIDGATEYAYTPSTKTAGSYKYTVEVTNTLTKDGVSGKATIVSDEAVVHVANPPQKPVVTTQPKGGVYFRNEAAAAMTVAAKVDDGGTLTYQWCDQNGPIEGATAESYVPTTAHVGTMTYYAVVTNTITGGFTATTETDRVQVKTLAPADQPVIINQPDSASYLRGETPIDLSVTALISDGGTLRYEWFADGQPVGTEQTYTPPIGVVGTTDYTVVITNTITTEIGDSSASTASKIATVSVFDHPDPSEPLNFEKPEYYLHTYAKTYDLAAVGSYIGDMESHSLKIDGSIMSPGFYSYQVEGSRMVITLNENVLYMAENGDHLIELQVVNNAGEVMDADTTVIVDWEFYFTSHFDVVTDRSVDAPATIETYERNGERITDVTVGGISLAAGEYEAVISGDLVTIILKPNGLNKISNGTYNVTVTFGNYGSATSMLKVMAAHPPIITADPQSADYNRGTPAKPLSVTAKSPDGGTLSYQWYKDGTAIEGATGREYTPSTETIGSAEYNVVVTNTIDDGTVTSSASETSGKATITVRELLIVKDLSRLLEPGEGTPSITLEIDAENAVSYQWYKDGQPLAGETGATLTIQKDGGDGNYYVLAIGSDGATVQSNTCQVKWSEGKGELEVDVETKPGVPNIVLDNYQDLVDGALTDEEKLKLAEDPNIKYIITLEADLITEDPIALALAEALGINIGQYLTLTITKHEIYSGQEPIVSEVSELNRTIRLIIDVPEALQKTGRTFKIIRVHNGVAEILEDLDDNPATITIETKLFSTYAIAYTDTVPVAPAFTSADNTTVTQGVGGTWQVTADGTTPLLFSLANAPQGISIDRNTGLMTIAPELAVGTYTFDITAVNLAGEATQSFTLRVNEPTPTPTPTPSLTTGKDVKTGDDANLGMMALLMLMALAGVGVTLARLKGNKG